MEVINVKEAREYVTANYPNDPLLKHIVLNVLEQLPKRQSVEPVQGWWLDVGDVVCFRCSNCRNSCNQPYGWDRPIFYERCPHCGAEMRGVKVDE